MSRTFVLIALLIFACGMLLNSCVKKVPEHIVWSQSLDEGLTLARDQGKNLLVEFYKEG